MNFHTLSWCKLSKNSLIDVQRRNTIHTHDMFQKYLKSNYLTS